MCVYVCMHVCSCMCVSMRTCVRILFRNLSVVYTKSRLCVNTRVFYCATQANTCSQMRHSCGRDHKTCVYPVRPFASVEESCSRSQLIYVAKDEYKATRCSRFPKVLK